MITNTVQYSARFKREVLDNTILTDLQAKNKLYTLLCINFYVLHQQFIIG